MSVEAVNQFLQKVGEDQKLQEELAKTIESNENDTEDTSKLGARYGYEFTPDELKQEVQKRQNEFQQRQQQGQLSDEELEAVAGGLCTPAILIATPLVSAVTGVVQTTVKVGTSPGVW